MLRKSGELVALVSAILCIIVVAGWIRSRHHADVILIQTPSHRVMGIATYHGGLLFAQSDLHLRRSEVMQDGAVRPATFVSPTPDEFAPIHDTIFDTTTQKFSFGGFKTAVGMATLSSQLDAEVFTR